MRELLVQKFHAGLRIGPDLRSVLSHPNRQRVLLHQGSLDGACALYCAVMALTLLEQVNPARRRSTSLGRLVKRFAIESPEQFFEGITDDDFEELVARQGLRVQSDRVNGSTGRCVAHAVRAVADGKLAVLSISSRGQLGGHATLAVGIEGVQRGWSFEPQALLCLDPNPRALSYGGYNARLGLDKPHGSIRYRRYSHAGSPRRSVSVWSSIVLWSK